MTDLARFDWNRLTANWEAWWRGELRRPMVHVRIEAPPGAVDAYPLHYMSMYDFSVPAEEILAVQEEYLKRCTYLADSYPSCWLNFGPGVLAAMIGGEGHNGENTVWFTPGRWENCDAAGIRPAFDPLRRGSAASKSSVAPPTGSGTERSTSAAPTSAAHWTSSVPCCPASGCSTPSTIRRTKSSG